MKNKKEKNKGLANMQGLCYVQIQVIIPSGLIVMLFLEV